MNILRLIVLLVVLSACAKKSTYDLLIGEWRITSWKTTSPHTDYKEKEMVENDETVIFEKDSLHIIVNNERDTYHYFLSGDSIIVPYALGGIYRIKLLNKKDLHLYSEINAIFRSEGENDEEMHSEMKIKLRKK